MYLSVQNEILVLTMQIDIALVRRPYSYQAVWDTVLPCQFTKIGKCQDKNSAKK